MSQSETLSIGDYDVLATLGQGAAGVAYRARSRETGEEVALKVLHARVAGDMELQKRFVREVSVLERLDHPNIVAHRECGIHEDKLYLAMELVDSGTLDTVLKSRGALPWRLAVEAAVQVCRALAHAHKQGVVHRDLKPANLFLSTEGGVKVGDFGLARDLNNSRLTVEGQTVGTCRFMAPEQVTGDADLTGAVDLYALGCLLFQMVTGQPPFDGATVVQVFEKHLFADPPCLSSRVPAIPETLDVVVKRLLAKEPADRPADANEAADLLQAVLDGAPLPEKPKSAEEDEEQPQTLTEQLMAPGAPKAASEANPMRALAIVAVVAAVGVIGWLVFGRG